MEVPVLEYVRVARGRGAEGLAWCRVAGRLCIVRTHDTQWENRRVLNLATLSPISNIVLNNSADRLALRSLEVPCPTGSAMELTGSRSLAVSG